MHRCICRILAKKKSYSSYESEISIKSRERLTIQSHYFYKKYSSDIQKQPKINYSNIKILKGTKALPFILPKKALCTLKHRKVSSQKDYPYFFKIKDVDIFKADFDV